MSGDGRFGARLRAAMDARGPLCVGIDPHPGLLSAWGLPDSPSGLERFTRTVVDALGDRAAVVKPQSAFFERFGSQGIAVLESAIRQLSESGALVLLDVKRGDIGSTAAAYADAYLDPASPLRVDAITASPFLGFGSLTPMIEKAVETGAGVFVLALTSNPEGPAVQHAKTADGRTVAQTIIDEVSQVNAGVSPLGDVGVVVGATIGETGHDMSSLGGPVLVPGLGAQGGRTEDLRAVFGDDLSFVLPSYSREILSQGPSVARLRDSLDRLMDACRRTVQPIG
ncbi:orotidine-5'-phosphate decarboxylase [Planosporangium flavigriseum]|uniref:Orotidine 5'-phosphate decarboxylase n=1 Tax=Planosporangium flavigriseum TaxID=373681 RepID=A0A8J3LRI5_9ACTN|nr:orotidine-5'-phosphate decarboxylase [Planosporangium flavigriseum]NJC66311.1 orotidine-5'-phosphate decarboxylase [Planosporangium flavigriseum]GIG75298.1 orotidine 5'-phosphate decarboxylase [Planosporangium flavigriseum]